MKGKRKMVEEIETAELTADEKIASLETRMDALEAYVAKLRKSVPYPLEGE
jgi:polyhydroxyalkanoate synthesis regulator phasin